jgi:hypothetical protein
MCVAGAYAQTTQPATGPSTSIGFYYEPVVVTNTPPAKTNPTPVINISQADKMIKDFTQKLESGEDYRDIVAANPALYNEYNVNDLVKMGLNEKYLDKAYDYLSKAELIIGAMEGDTTELTKNIFNAGTQVAQRPLNTFLDKVKILYKDNKDICDETDTSKLLSKIADALIKESGIISSQVEAEIIFGTGYNLYRDSFFYQSDQLPLNKDLSHHMDLIRVLILANSKEVRYEGNKNSIVDLFTENVRMTNAFCGAGTEGNSNLTELTKDSPDFKLVDEVALRTFSMIKSHIELDNMMKTSGSRY